MPDSLSTTSDASFANDVLGASQPVFVDFWATWCAPCKAMVPHLQKMQDELGEQVKIIKLNVEQNQATATQYKVLKLPTILRFQDGQVVDKMIGNPGPRKLRDFLSKTI